MIRTLYTLLINLHPHRKERRRVDRWLYIHDSFVDYLPLLPKKEPLEGGASERKKLEKEKDVSRYDKADEKVSEDR